MTLRRRHVALLLALVVVGWVLSLLKGSPSAAPRLPAPSVAGAPAPGTTTLPGAARQAAAALDRVQRAFNARNVGLLCGPGAIVDRAVIREQDAQSGGCEGEVETLMGDEPAMRLQLRALAVRGHVATATVTTSRDTRARVDLVRQGRRWLLSFSDTDDPLPALAGAA